MSDAERQILLRAVRQRLEALGRAGLDRIPVPLPAAPVMADRPASPTASALVPVAEPPPTDLRKPPAAPPAPARVVPVAPAALFGDPELEGPVLPASDRPAALVALAAEVAGCRRCSELAHARTQTVFGVGNPTARLMFIGEAPGADEDRQGEPFVGAAGRLLNDMITKGMGLRRQDIYIANILKCRPPSNRDPQPAESDNCIGYLERQLAIVRPEYLCLLGRIAAQRLLDTVLPMSRLRGRWHNVRGIPTIVTYHPAALLRNPAWKKDAWEDLKMLMRAMGLKVPEAKAPRSG